jgi:UDP-N-acetylmuramate--alanine ligase
MYNPKLHFHFTGIGGSGMSGIAEVLINLGFTVSGSDLNISDICKRLSSLGAQILEGHAAEHLPKGASLLVYSSAVSSTNPEVLEARSRGIPVIPRAEVLAELLRLKYGIVVAGSHGKTTTTSLIGAVLEEADLSPTIIVGGRLKSAASGGKLGKGDFLVAESDESDRSFLILKPTIAIVTNIDTEHMSAYGSITELEQSFDSFARSVPFYGLGIFCIDDQRVRTLIENYSKRKTTYGLSPDAQITAKNIKHDKNRTHFTVFKEGKQLAEVTLAMPGTHLVVNSLAAFAVGLELSIDPAIIARALSKFGGVARRLEVLVETKGITVISDYGHHPTEVRATLRAVRSGWESDLNRLHVVFQPHRYSRTKECFADFLTAFTEADTLIISDIYAASETPIKGVSGDSLCKALAAPKSREFIGKLSAASECLRSRVEKGDVVLFLGAGSIGAEAEAFARALND